MNKNILWGIGVAAIAVLLLESLTSMAFIASLAAGLGIGAVSVIALISLSRGEQPQVVAKEVVTTAKAVVSEPRSLFDERSANEQLARVYEELLLSAKAPEVGPGLQELIIELRPAVSRALQFAEASETTFNLVKLAKEDLPKAVRFFLDQSDVDRAAKQSDFIAQLKALSGKVKELISIIDAGQADAFNAQSSFINLKFN
jgi:hypothetical protein